MKLRTKSDWPHSSDTAPQRLTERPWKFALTCLSTFTPQPLHSSKLGEGQAGVGAAKAKGVVERHVDGALLGGEGHVVEIELAVAGRGQVDGRRSSVLYSLPVVSVGPLTKQGGEH